MSRSPAKRKKQLFLNVEFIYSFKWTEHFYRHQQKSIDAVEDLSFVFLQYRCLGSVLFNNGFIPRATWITREGEQMKYWGGATSRRDFYCACAETSKWRTFLEITCQLDFCQVSNFYFLNNILQLKFFTQDSRVLVQNRLSRLFVSIPWLLFCEKLWMRCISSKKSDFCQ